MRLTPFHLHRRSLQAFLATAISFAGLALPARADVIRFEVSNLTASGGDPVFNVATDVTFTGLQLTGNYANAQSSVIPLLGNSGTPVSMLDTLTIFLDSSPLNNPSASLGSLLSATLSGALSTHCSVS